VGPGSAGMELKAAWGDPESAVTGVAAKPLIYASSTAAVTDFAQAQALGEAVAASLRAAGAVWAGHEMPSVPPSN
jgi:hydroxymethylbilane synthase